MLKKIIAINLPFGLTKDQIVSLTQSVQFKYSGTPSGLSETSTGFEAFPWGEALETQNGIVGLQYVIATKNIPETYLKSLVSKEVSELEKREFRILSRQEKLEIRSRFRETLLPNALPQISKHLIIFDLKNSICLFDTEKVQGDVYALIEACEKNVSLCSFLLPKSLGGNFNQIIKDALFKQKLVGSFVAFSNEFIIESIKEKNKKITMRDVDLSMQEFNRFLRDDSNWVVGVGLKTKHAEFHLDNRMNISKIKLLKKIPYNHSNDNYEKAIFELNQSMIAFREIIAGVQYLMGIKP